MWQFIIFIRDGIADIADMLEKFSFDFGSFSVSLFDLLIGLIATGFVISVFWKGART